MGDVLRETDLAVCDIDPVTLVPSWCSLIYILFSHSWHYLFAGLGVVLNQVV